MINTRKIVKLIFGKVDFNRFITGKTFFHFIIRSRHIFRKIGK